MKKFIGFIFAIFATIAHAGVGVHTLGIIGASLITPGNLTFSPDEIRSFFQGISETAFKNPDFMKIHNVVEGIVAGDKIGYFGLLSKVTKTDAGCGTGKAPVNIPTSQKAWAPAKTKIWISMCLDDLDSTFIVYLKKTGVDVEDWTGTEMMSFLMDRVATAKDEDLWRIVWFNDTTAANVDDSPAGVITTGVSLTDYNIIDGFWPQIYTIVSGDATKRVTVTKNGGLTKVLQEFDTTDTTNKVVTG